MGSYARSIKVAVDKISGEVIDADKVFADKKEAFSIRQEFHGNEIELSCYECGQKLNVSTSKYDRLHFKHQPDSDYCILKDGSLPQEEIERFNKTLLAKESSRHKKLKNKIAEKLLKVDGVDTFSIAIDNKFIIRGNEKRRPDVYCKYFDKELVFEIQLSDLSLRYILSRYEFYKKHKMYLIWILDNFDVHKQGQLERDIKYLTEYQNFFNLDEKTNDFRLNCKYKYPFITEENELHTKWCEKSVSLSQINFDQDSFQIFYYNFGLNKSKIEENQKRKCEEIKEAEIRKQTEKIFEDATTKSDYIIQEIRRLKERKSFSFDSVIYMLDELDNYELEILKSRLNFCNREKSKLHEWINSATPNDYAFIKFILDRKEIDIDVNEKDLDGRTAFQAIHHSKLNFKHSLVLPLLKRGYILKPEDEISADTSENWLTYTLCDKLSNRDLVDYVSDHKTLLFIIESSRRNEIIGFNYRPDQWLSFANNAAHNYSKYWKYIELAFKHYGILDRLIKLDKKGTFQKKILNLSYEIPLSEIDREQISNFDKVFSDLYSEINAQL